MKICRVLILFTILIGMSACSASEKETAVEPSRITLSEAREFQNSVLLDLATYVPADSLIGGMDAPLPEMSGMTCDWARKGGAASSESGVFLPGGYDIEVSSDVDLAEVLDQIRLDYLEKGWEAHEGSSKGRKSVRLASPEGYEFFLTALSIKDGSLKLVMNSFSPCVKVPENFSLFDRY